MKLGEINEQGESNRRLNRNNREIEGPKYKKEIKKKKKKIKEMTCSK